MLRIKSKVGLVGLVVVLAAAALPLSQMTGAAWFLQGATDRPVPTTMPSDDPRLVVVQVTWVEKDVDRYPGALTTTWLYGGDSKVDPYGGQELEPWKDARLVVTSTGPVLKWDKVITKTYEGGAVEVGAVSLHNSSFRCTIIVGAKRYETAGGRGCGAVLPLTWRLSR